MMYHAYLILTNQTTWEHSRRNNINYLNKYPPNIYPFDFGIKENIKLVFFNKGITIKWKPKNLETAVEMEKERFNWCDNKYYSCC